MVFTLSASTATGIFVLYAALNGATLSAVFLSYTQSSIASTFFVCAGTFVAASIYGWTTKEYHHLIDHPGISCGVLLLL